MLLLPSMALFVPGVSTFLAPDGETFKAFQRLRYRQRMLRYNPRML